jgi:hypothetical protein
MSKHEPDEKPRSRGRPRTKDPAKTYAGLSYILCSFRLNKRSVAEADTIRDCLGLGTRTAAVQFALGQLFKTLPEASGRSPEEIRDLLGRYLAELGVE